MLRNDILLQSSCVNTHSQNEVVERKNRRLLEIAWALLFQMHVPKHFWADAVFATCFLIDRIPSSVLNWATPFQTLIPHKSLLSIEPRVFVCTCFVWHVCPDVSKLDPKSLNCIFLGYSRARRGYRCYCPSLRRYLFLLMSLFLRILFFLKTRSTLVGVDDNLLVYTLALLALASVHPLTKPPITQV